MQSPEILQILLENGKMTFNEIVKDQNRNTCNKVLDELIEAGFVQIEPKKWRRGQRKWFTLTKKGQAEFIKRTMANVNENLRCLDVFSSKLNADEVRDTEDSEAKADWEEMVHGRRTFKNKTFQEKSQIYTQKQIQYRKPIYDTLRRLQKIMVRLQRGQDNYKEYVAIVKGDGSDPLTIPLRLLEGIDFNGLFWVSAISNRQDAEIKWKYEDIQGVSEELLG